MVGYSETVSKEKRPTIEDLVPVWINFTYENLSDFCFGCGLMGHGLKEWRM